MSRITHASPLRAIQHTVTSVRQYGHEPLVFRQKDEPLYLEILSYFSQIELLLEKRALFENPINREAQDGLDLKIDRLESRINSLWEQMDLLDKSTQKDYLQQVGMRYMYPKASNHLLSDKKDSQSDIVHYKELSLLYQLYQIANDIQNGLCLPDHTYIAYQLALLYQCVNQQDSLFDHYKVRIELEFEGIRVATKQPGLIQNAQSDWLYSLTKDLKEFVTKVLGQQITTSSLVQTMANMESLDSLRDH
ncbi:hypothetical protein CLU79DRAFT_746643 [Phycomyces nitens]|nr:hypothetical protein CLU79DRAFT_746643 [Phycomyces nitens]